jgi:hypothetical protein
MGRTSFQLLPYTNHNQGQVVEGGTIPAPKQTEVQKKKKTRSNQNRALVGCSDTLLVRKQKGATRRTIFCGALQLNKFRNILVTAHTEERGHLDS